MKKLLLIMFVFFNGLSFTFADNGIEIYDDIDGFKKYTKIKYNNEPVTYNEFLEFKEFSKRYKKEMETKDPKLSGFKMFMCIILAVLVIGVIILFGILFLTLIFHIADTIIEFIKEKFL